MIVCEATASWETFWQDLAQAFAFLAQIALPLLPYIGLEEDIVSLFILGIVLMIASGVGIHATRNKRRKIWRHICVGFEILSALITISSAMNL